MTEPRGRRRASAWVRPTGRESQSTYWVRRAVTLFGVVCAVGLVAAAALIGFRSVGTTAPQVATGETAAPAPVETASTSEPAPTPSSSASPKSKKKKKDKQAASQEPNWMPVGGSGDWSSYPWGSDGLECPHPSGSPGAGAGSDVVVLGDSLIRDSREALTAALADYGIAPVFVCWGGKTLGWGEEQLAAMQALDVTPQCLVINLGTNDLKGTTAAGLADAVDLSTVQQRLVSLLSAASSIPHVFAVDIAADLSAAPSTMAEVGDAPDVWRQAVGATGVGEVVPWASATQGGADLIGPDGIHDTYDGRVVRAGLIADAVARYCS